MKNDNDIRQDGYRRMNKGNVKDDVYKSGEILVDAIVIYTDGTKELFDAVRIIDKRVVTGRVLNNKFVDYGFIPRCNIKEIYNGRKVIFNNGNRLL